MRMVGRKFLERKIRATVIVELPYSNELLQDNKKLNNKIRAVLAQGEFPCTVQTGKDLPFTGTPVTTHKEL